MIVLHICPLFLRDSLEHKEVGMIALEMAMVNGILNGILNGPVARPWTLALNWNDLKVHIVGEYIGVRSSRACIGKTYVKQGC